MSCPVLDYRKSVTGKLFAKDSAPECDAIWRKNLEWLAVATVSLKMVVAAM